MLYGYVIDDTFPLLVTYAVGDVLNIGFIAVYFRYSKRRAYVLKVSMLALVCNAAVTLYAVLSKRDVLIHHSSETRNQVVGFIAIASSLLLYASPFSAISRVVKTKSSASIPITMCLVGVVNNGLWIIYGCLLRDLILIVPTSVNLVLGLTQVLLFVVYHPTRRFCGRRSPAGASMGNTTLPTVVTPSTDKHEVHFASMTTPKNGAGAPDSDAAITASAISIQSAVELSKITLEAPSYEQTRPPQHHDAFTPEV